MSKIIIYIYFIISLIIHPQQSIANTINIKDIQYIINEIAKESEELIGGAIAIIQNEQIIYKKSFGYTKINGPSINDNTLFSLASVSKPIIATAIASLAERNLISFEDVISINGINFSLKNILSHTTGYNIRGDSEIEKGISRETLLGLLKRKRQTHLTSKQYFYSNLIYSLTQDYAQSKGYTIDELIKILHISLYTLPVSSSNLALPHSKEKKSIAFPSNYQIVVPTSAGIFSSLNEMIEFLHIILGNRQNIISKEILNEIFTPITKAEDVFNWNILPFKNSEIESSYCLGWRKLILKSNSKSTLIFHSGYINGATAFIGIIPELQVGIVILVNQSSRFPVKNGLKIWKTIIEQYKL